MTYPELPECIRPSSLDLKLKSNVKRHVSPWTGGTQTVGFTGSRWQISMSFDNLNDWESRQIDALFFGLDGHGRIKLRDYGRCGVVPQGAPIVFGAGQRGTILATQGWQAGRLVLRKGDFFTVQNELKMLTADAWSDTNGRATLEFTPQLRNETQNGDPIETREPWGIFIPVDNDMSAGRRPAFMSSIKVDFVEAIDVPSV